jgi:hypothetical protein
MKLDGFVFGKLTHDAGEAPMASFRRYDKARGAILSTALASFGTGKLTDQRVRAEAEQLVAKLLGAAQPAVLAVRAVAKPAEAQAGNTPQTPQAPSPATVAATEESAQPPQTVEPAQLSPADKLSLRRFTGYALLGGAAASVGLSVLSFVQVERAGSNSSFQEYRSLVGMANDKIKDVCDEASANRAYGLAASRFREVKSSCSTGGTFEILQYVFIGSALVTGGLATFFLFGGDDSRGSTKNTAGKLTLHPAIRGAGATVTARYYF